ncbi:MAG: hypothetical protein ACK5S6_01815 [bacterium]
MSSAAAIVFFNGSSAVYRKIQLGKATEPCYNESGAKNFWAYNLWLFTYEILLLLLWRFFCIIFYMGRRKPKPEPPKGFSVITLKGCLKMAAKIANYSAEQTAEILAGYIAGETVETLAERMGKSTRSIVAKLSREGVYKKKEYVGKTGEKPVKKDVHADAIGAILRLPENDVESLTKANKTALKAIFDALANSQPV